MYPFEVEFLPHLSIVKTTVGYSGDAAVEMVAAGAEVLTIKIAIAEVKWSSVSTLRNYTPDLQ